MGRVKMKYFKLNDDVYAFEEDGTQDFLITDDFIKMSNDEIDRHINPEKYMTDEEKEELYLMSFMPLTKRQFKLALLDHDLLETVEKAIESIEDIKLKARISIEYSDSETFERTNESVKLMLEKLDLSSGQVDEMWNYALTL